MTDELIDYNDDWANTITGLGSIRDKSTGIVFERRSRLARTTLDAMYEQNPIIARVVDRIVDDALRNGFDLEIEGYDARGQEISDHEVDEKIKEFDLMEHVGTAAKWSRLYGGALLTIPTIGGGDPDQPLYAPKAMLQPVPIGAYEAIPDKTDGAFGSPTFRKTLTWRISTMATSEIVLHRSRAVALEPVKLPPEALQTSPNGWGPSVIDRVYDSLARYGATQRHAAAMLYVASVLYIKMNRYRDTAISKKGREQLRTILSHMRQGLDSLGLMGLDAQDELGTLSLSLGGLPETMDRFADALAASCEMPKEILFNESPAGLNAGELSGPQEIWNNRVNAYQEQELEPIIQYWLSVGFRAWGWSVDKLDIKWRPLWTPSEEKTAQVAATWAQADNVYYQMGALTESEIREHRFEEGREGPVTVEPEFKPVVDLSQAIEAEQDAQEAITPPPGDVKSAADLAQMLNVSAAVIRGLHKRGEIGGWRVGGRWRFSEAEILKHTQRPV